MINSNSTLVVIAMKNIIDFFSIILDLCHFTMTRVAQLIYIHQLTPLLQSVLHFLDWPSTMSSYNAIMRITQVSKTDNNLLVFPSVTFLLLSSEKKSKILLLVNLGLGTPSP
jgi:hypothetical protein